MPVMCALCPWLLPWFPSETKGQWARDDATFVLLQLGFLAVRPRCCMAPCPFAFHPFLAPLPCSAVLFRPPYLCLFLCVPLQVAAFAYGIAFHRPVTEFIWLLFNVIGQFFLPGLLISTLTWYWANNKLKQTAPHR